MAKAKLKNVPTITVELMSFCDLPSVDDLLVHQAIGFDDRWYELYACKPLDYTEEVNHATFPKIKPENSQNYRIYAYENNRCVLDVSIAQCTMNYHFIAPLPNEQLLLSCARTCYRPHNQSDLNAHIYDNMGCLKNCFLLGDGIQDIQTNEVGMIWTSYFDEGVFGNFGWSEPIGRNGLLAWNTQGEIIYRYKALPEINKMADCYALNVTSVNDTWICYYVDFPIVHLRNKKIINYWYSPIAGSHYFATDNKNYILMQGGYNDRDNIYLIVLKDNHQAKIVAKLNLLYENTNIIGANIISNKANCLYLKHGYKVYILSIDQAIQQYTHHR